MSVSISSVSFEHHHQAFGIGEASPRISWRFEGDARDWEQTGYEIEITHDGVPRIFSANSSESALVSWPDEPLCSSEAATVRVRAYGGGGATKWSNVVSVETALLDGDWAGAIPIAADRETEVNTTHKPILFRKGFDINFVVTSARLYITGLGIYQAEINGQRVGDHVLAPGYMSYQFRHTYDTYDVTELIQRGNNAIGVTVAEGWWSGRFGFTGQRNIYGDTIGLLALLSITHEDGTKQTVKTDLTWRASADGPTISAQLYDGEFYDSRLEIDCWSDSKFNDSKWLVVKQLPELKGKVTPPDGPPMRKVQMIEPRNVFQSPSGKTLIDFGQNLVGWLRLNVQGLPGTNITIRHAEVLDEREIGVRPLHSAKATDTFILNGRDNQVWEPSFTYHGFRFIEVNGWPNSTALDAEHLRAVVVHSDMERIGHFECSDKLLNRFHENVVWSMLGNFLSVPTDCPQRDERLGWTGDAHAFMPTSNYLYDTSGFWRSWLKDLWSETSTGGLNSVPHFVPTLDPNFVANGSNNFRTPTAIWGYVIVGNPWALYQSTGDKRMLEEQYVGARAWIDSGVPRNEAGLWNRSTFQYADWLDPLSPSDDPGAATTAKHLVADAYLIQMTRLLSHISSALDKPDAALKYALDREGLISEFHSAWIEPYAGLIANLTQTAQTALTLGLRFDIFDAATRSQAASTLNSIISNNSFLVGTGFAGTQQLGFALSSINSTSTFYKMLLQTQVPSWLYQVVMNGTTTWERWDSMLPDGSINPGEMTNFNHYAFGIVADWMHQKIGGLAPGEPGWKTTLIVPEPGGNITSANATYMSPYGLIRSTWSVTDAGFKLQVQIPPNAKADIVLPDGENEINRVGSGVHEFAVDGYIMPE